MLVVPILRRVTMTTSQKGLAETNDVLKS
ncbi:MAG: hypothetical protein K0R18_1178, partial [Bacillales bacterium]|nr:hypothetical protein [Bacillales bacterium]